MSKKSVLFCLFSVLYGGLMGQIKSEDAIQYEEQYKINIQKEYINGIYIPKDIAEAFSELNRLVDTESKGKYKALGEIEASKKLFFSFGRWMIIKWNFYEGSRFSHYLREVGLSHPDDMAFFVMILYHRHLNKQQLDVKNLIAQIKEGEFKEKPLQKSN